MSTQIFANIRKRLLCTLDASDVVMLAKGVAPPETSTSPGELEAALGLAPYASVTQRKLQTLSLLGSQAGVQDGVSSQHVGVVVEFGVEHGTDALAAFSDGVAAWFDATAGTLAEATLSSDAKEACQSLIAAGVRIREVTGKATWDTPPPPPVGFVCISLITEAGISYGLGPMRDLASDGHGGPIIHWALNLRKVVLSARMTAESSA